MLPVWVGKDWCSFISVSFLCDLSYQTQFLFYTNHVYTALCVELVQQHGQQDWMVGLPLCFALSLDIPILTTAKRDRYIRRLLFLTPTSVTEGFSQASIPSPEAAIWWSSCQVYSYPHSSNNPVFISLLVFLAFTLFRKADVGVPSQWSIMILLLQSSFSLPFPLGLFDDTFPCSNQWKPREHMVHSL